MGISTEVIDSLTSNVNSYFRCFSPYYDDLFREYCSSSLVNLFCLAVNRSLKVIRDLRSEFPDYISQTPFEIYEKTNGRNFPVSASNHFLTHWKG